MNKSLANEIIDIGERLFFLFLLSYRKDNKLFITQVFQRVAAFFEDVFAEDLLAFRMA